jgi:deoxyribose-phosphate aldolase
VRFHEKENIITLTAVIEANQTVVTFVVCKTVLVHHIKTWTWHTGSHATESLQAQAEIWARRLTALARFAAAASRNISFEIRSYAYI